MMRKLIYISVFILTVSMLTYADVQKNATQLYDAANQEYKLKHLEASIKLFLQADSAYKAEDLTGTAEYAQALNSMGFAYLDNNDIQKGREYLRQALELNDKLYGKISEKYIASLDDYAFSFRKANELEEALKYQKEVIDLCSKINPPHTHEGKYLLNLARIYYAKQDEDSTLLYMEAALPKVEKFSPDYEGVLNYLGWVYMERNDNSNSYRIMGLMEEHNQHELTKECNTPECHLERAGYYMAIGKTANAKEEFNEVFSFDLSDEQKAKAYEKYGQFFHLQRDFSQAGEYYTMAANSLIMAKGDCENATTLLSNAGMYFFLGYEYDKAIDLYNKVIENVDKYGYDHNLKSTSLKGLGNVYFAKDDYPLSIMARKKWIEHLKLNSHENETDYAEAYEKLASVEKFNSDYDASISDYETAISLYEKLGMIYEAEQARDGLETCLIYARKDRGERVDNEAAILQHNNIIRDNIKSSIDILEQAGDYLGDLSNARSLATIAGSYAQLMDYDNAVDYYSRYIAAIRKALVEDFLLKNPQERELTWKQELSNIKQMNRLIAEIPEDKLELYNRLSNLIYEGQLLSKGILLSSNIEFDRVLSQHGTSEMKNQYQQIKNNLIEIDRMKQQRCPLEEIQAKIRETDALQLELARSSASKGIFTDFLKYTTADVASALGDDEVAIEFVTLSDSYKTDEDMIAAVVVSKEYPAGITKPICKVGDIKTIIGDKEKYSNDYYSMVVWLGVQNEIRDKKKIYFAPDGILNNIGIEYLSVDGKPMNETIEMIRLSSTREICREHTSKPLRYASLFGDVDYDGLSLSTETGDKPESRAKRGADTGNFNPLGNTGREVREISGILKKNIKKSRVSSFTGEKASKAEFLSQKESPANLLHIATHGKYVDGGDVSNDDAMHRSILAFAGANLYDDISENEGIITAAEIADMSLQNCELVVLSACESGLGKLDNDGVFGLQRGFKNAGVKSLLVSLNEVADEVTADMMIAFYRNHISKAMSKQDALKKAQSEIRTKYPNDDTWASFILIDSFN